MNRYAVPIAAMAVAVAFQLVGCSPSSRTSLGELEEPNYRLFDTENMWTRLLLDTRNGRIWQVQFTVEAESLRGALPVNEKKLANGRPGRFTLEKTDNMWTFLLLDQDDGDVWQCQFSMEPGNEGIWPVPRL